MLREDIIRLYIFGLGSFLIILVVLWYREEVFNHVRHIIVALCTVELVGRYLDFLEVSDRIDVVNVYFLVWQLVSLVWKWMWHRFPSPILFIEQASLCIFISFVAFLGHNTIFRYFPREVVMVILWILSVADM
jgi:hypothetical protein